MIGATRLKRLQALTCAIIACVSIVGCTYVPFETPRKATVAAPAEGTRASFLADRLTGGHPGEVALVALPGGNEALGARLRMIEEAERSIDLSTFLVKPDASGALIWLALLDAAQRGVRIRFLIDDVFTTAEDKQIAALDTHPNVEIRYFNPLSRNSPPALNFLLDFSRVNRRMHNKAMIVDGSLAIVGGRNIADEYYQVVEQNEFADFDLFVAGQPVDDLSDAFDLYWNDRWSVPVSAFAAKDGSQLSFAVEFFQRLRASDAVRQYGKATRSSFVEDLRSGKLRRFSGRAHVVVDDPSKLRRPPSKGPYPVASSLYSMMNTARSEILILTPYFVPEDYGARFFEKMVRKGVRVRIITNSLASTNHPYVHGAYSRYRDRLLDAGVEMAEVRADAPKLMQGIDANLTMHTKLAVVDGKRLFVGSTNIDPRSVRQNTEIGMIVESPELARAISQRVTEAANGYAFTVSRNEEGEIRWTYLSEGRSFSYRSDPGAGIWRKFVATVAGFLPIDSQL